LLIGAVLLAAAALTGAQSTRSPGLRAVACWLPIAAASVAAVIWQRGDLAVSIIFCTSVASLSLVQGTVLLIAPHDDSPTAFRRLWPFAVPVALMTLLAGFATKLTWLDALIFLCEGGVLWLAWTHVGKNATDSRQPEEARPPALISLLWAVLAVLGAVAALWGTLQASVSLAMPTANVMILGVLGPLLVMPLLLAGSSLAHRKLSWSATTTAVGVVLLNLCLLLPVVILLWYVRSAIGADWPASWQAFLSAMADAPPVVFPLITWRVDNIILLLLAFVLLPAALERWRLGQAEGITLIGFYMVYFLMELIVGTKL
jgi:Ca2+/Na+ antiporter